ncbi:putative MFS family arabinose efflux permease [Pedobacter sp. UYP24]
MITGNYLTKAKRATQAVFLVCGLAMSSWAPMVPLTKQRLGLNDADLGLLLLMVGAGAILTMPISGFLSRRFGTRIIILMSGLLIAISLPLLLIMPNPILMGAALFVFGAGIGTMDVTMNSHGIHVQKSIGKPIMSSLHGLFSVGGLCGSLGLGVLIKSGLNPIIAAVSISALLILILIWKYNALFGRKMELNITNEHQNSGNMKSNPMGWLNGRVILLGLACFAVFLSEGAMLDWSALFLQENKNVVSEFAGIGYSAFSIAMASMRFLGDKMVEKLNGKTVVVAGGLVAASGIFLAVGTPWLATALLGFVLLGVGAANIVPVFFTEGGNLKGVAASIAIPIISTMGYAGQLAGPALLGFIAFHFSLNIALGAVGLLLFVVAITYSLRKS